MEFERDRLDGRASRPCSARASGFLLVPEGRLSHLNEMVGEVNVATGDRAVTGEIEVVPGANSSMMLQVVGAAHRRTRVDLGVDDWHEDVRLVSDEEAEHGRSPVWGSKTFVLRLGLRDSGFHAAH